MPLFDFICTEHHRSELLRPASVREVPCPQCGRTAARGEVNLISMAMGGTADWAPLVRDDGRIRTPVNERRIPMRQFHEATEQLSYEHSRAEQSLGRELPPPPLARTAIASARKLMKAGVTDSLDAPK